jgi:hypothetical protein
MRKTKQRKLEAAGWRVGSAAEFLALSPEETALVETKLALSTALRARRTAQHLSQGALAKRLKSSQSRVARWRPLTVRCQWTSCSASSSRSARHPATWRRPSSTGAAPWLPNGPRISGKRLARAVLTYVPLNQHRRSAFDRVTPDACRLHALVRLPHTMARRTLLSIPAVCFEGHNEPDSQQEGLYGHEYGRAGPGGLSLVGTGSEHSEKAKHNTKPT